MQVSSSESGSSPSQRSASGAIATRTVPPAEIEVELDLTTTVLSFATHGAGQPTLNRLASRGAAVEGNTGSGVWTPGDFGLPPVAVGPAAPGDVVIELQGLPPPAATPALAPRGAAASRRISIRQNSWKDGANLNITLDCLQAQLRGMTGEFPEAVRAAAGELEAYVSSGRKPSGAAGRVVDAIEAAAGAASMATPEGRMNTLLQAAFEPTTFQVAQAWLRDLLKQSFREVLLCVLVKFAQLALESGLKKAFLLNPVIGRVLGCVVSAATSVRALAGMAADRKDAPWQAQLGRFGQVLILLALMCTIPALGGWAPFDIAAPAVVSQFVAALVGDLARMVWRTSLTIPDMNLSQATISAAPYFLAAYFTGCMQKMTAPRAGGKAFEARDGAIAGHVDLLQTAIAALWDGAKPLLTLSPTAFMLKMWPSAPKDLRWHEPLAVRYSVGRLGWQDVLRLLHGVDARQVGRVAVGLSKGYTSSASHFAADLPDRMKNYVVPLVGYVIETLAYVAGLFAQMREAPATAMHAPPEGRRVSIRPAGDDGLITYF